MLLSQRTMEELYLTDTNHPRLRRHHACVNVIADYRRDVSVTKIPPSHSYSVPPSIFKNICLHYNTEVLFLPNDLPISTIGLWRILIRSPVELHVVVKIIAIIIVLIFNINTNFIVFIIDSNGFIIIISLIIAIMSLFYA